MNIFSDCIKTLVSRLADKQKYGTNEFMGKIKLNELKRGSVVVTGSKNNCRIGEEFYNRRKHYIDPWLLESSFSVAEVGSLGG